MFEKVRQIRIKERSGYRNFEEIVRKVSKDTGIKIELSRQLSKRYKNRLCAGFSKGTPLSFFFLMLYLYNKIMQSLFLKKIGYALLVRKRQLLFGVNDLKKPESINYKS